MALAALRLECLGGGNAGAITTTRSAYVPFDIVAAAGDRIPVVVAFGIPGDGKHLPAPINLDAFDDVDSRHKFSPASRILTDSKKDRKRCNCQKINRVGRIPDSTAQHSQIDSKDHSPRLKGPSG